MTDTVNRTATYVKVMKEYNGDARLLRVEPPLEVKDDSDGCSCECTCGVRIKHYSHVVASAVTAFQGEIITFVEVGGQRGTLDHNLALTGMGWEVV